MAGYLGNIPVPQATQTREVFTATASQTSFATAGYPVGFVDVWLNGVKLINGTDFTATNGSDVVLTVGAAAGDTVEVISNSTFEVADRDFTGDTSAENFTVTGTFTSRGIDDNATSTAVTLDASGNLLVGTTAANGNFTVQGSAAASYAIYTAAHPTNGYNIACRGVTTTGVAIRFLNSAGTDVGSIDYTSTATSYTTSSDYRLKEDVQPMVGASERVLALNPVNFAWKVDGSRVDGFLAHEAQAVVPEAVHGEKDAVDAGGNPVYQGIDQSKLVPLLTAALQEALGRITALEARVAALEA